MSKIIPGNWTIKLTPEQIEAIDWYQKNPPKYYKFFYKLWNKVLGKVFFLIMLLCFVLAIIHSTTRFDLFDTIKYIFFGNCVLGLWVLISHLCKMFYTKRYANKIGLTLDEWNWVNIGMEWDI